MKTFMMIMLLLVAVPAYAQPENFVDELRGCTELSVLYTKIATIAADSADSDKRSFDAYIQHIVSEQQSDKSKALVTRLGALAWKTRKNGTVSDSAMGLYDACVDSVSPKI